MKDFHIITATDPAVATPQESTCFLLPPTPPLLGVHKRWGLVGSSKLGGCLQVPRPTPSHERGLGPTSKRSLGCFEGGPDLLLRTQGLVCPSIPSAMPLPMSHHTSLAHSFQLQPHGAVIGPAGDHLHHRGPHRARNSR